MIAEQMTYRAQKKFVESLGMAVVDGLGLTYSCADYPAWIRNMNGWPVEDIARAAPPGLDRYAAGDES